MGKIFLTCVFLSILVLALSVKAFAGSTDAVFITVTGDVKIQDVKGMSREARVGSAVKQGETVSVAKEGFADLQLFDGSHLELTAGARLTLDLLKKPSEKGKQIHSSLISGRVKAIVHKLMTASSHFEIAAGGVLFGVRGTQFSVDCDKALERVVLQVMEGSVYAKVGSKIYIYQAGQGAEFLKGELHSNRSESPSPSMAGVKEEQPESQDLALTSLSLQDLSLQFGQSLLVASSDILANPSVPAFGSALKSEIHLVDSKNLLTTLP